MTGPDEQLPGMGLRRAVGVTGLVLLAELATSAWGWATIPAGTLIPTHWGITGEADGFTPKEPGLLLLPAVTFLLALLLVVLPRFEPRRANLARSAGSYRTVVVGFVVFMGAIHLVAVLAAGGVPVDVGRSVTLGIGLFFALIGNQLGKVRSNYLFGIRTPWTLASDLSWNRTHRATGRLWVAGGLALALLALAGASGPVLAGSLFGWLLVTTLAAVVYSYRVWARDPDRGAIHR